MMPIPAATGNNAGIIGFYERDYYICLHMTIYKAYRLYYYYYGKAPGVLVCHDLS